MQYLVTIEELIRLYGDSLWAKGQHRQSSLGYLIEISQIKEEGFSAFVEDDYRLIADKLEALGNSDATINRKIAALTKLLRRAQQDGKIPNVPVYRRRKEDQDALRYLSIFEEQDLRTALASEEPYYAEFSSFLIDTGVKPGEAVSLRWENISNGTIIVSGSKSTQGRTIPLTQRAQSVLTDLDHEVRGPFYSIDLAKFRLIWNIAKEKLGWHEKSIVPQVLRHTCASRLVLSGLDTRLVQRWLGIRNYQAMRRYEKLIRTDDFSLCAKALESFAAVEDATD